MAEEATERKPLEDWGDTIIEASEGGASEFDDYVMLEAEEPFKAHITKIKKGEKFNKTSQEMQDRVYIFCELDESDGKGQTYRCDFNPKLSKPDQTKQTYLADFLKAVYGTPQLKFDPKDLIGRPLRVMLSEPWTKPGGDKPMQFINKTLKPTADQKKVESDVELTPEEAAEIMGGEVVDGDSTES